MLSLIANDCSTKSASVTISAKVFSISIIAESSTRICGTSLFRWLMTDSGICDRKAERRTLTTATLALTSRQNYLRSIFENGELDLRLRDFIINAFVVEDCDVCVGGFG